MWILSSTKSQKSSLYHKKSKLEFCNSSSWFRLHSDRQVEWQTRKSILTASTWRKEAISYVFWSKAYFKFNRIKKKKKEEIHLPWWLNFEFFKYFWIKKRKHYHFLKCKDVMTQSSYTIKTHLRKKKSKACISKSFS